MYSHWFVFFSNRCEAICFLGSYEEPRAALVLTPYFTSDSIVVGSLDSLIEKEGSQESKTSLKTVINRAWQNLVSSCVSALAAGVASSDFQYLVDMQGRTLVLDLTEARILQFASQNKVDDRQFNRELELEQQLVRSFIGELRSNMPSVLGDDGEVYLNTLLIDKLSTKPFFQFLFVEK